VLLQEWEEQIFLSQVVLLDVHQVVESDTHGPHRLGDIRLIGSGVDLGKEPGEFVYFPS